MVERNEIIIAANLLSFASQSYWPISEGKKNLIRELCYKREENHGEKRDKKEKVKELIVRERASKIMFPIATDEDNIYKRCNAWERDFFTKKKKGGKQLIGNKPYFY